MTESLSFGAAGVLSSSEPPRNPQQDQQQQRTREEIVLAHAYLCGRAARRFVRADLERGDLEQVAAIGLLKAVDRYDERRGTPFEAFAWLVILGELLHHVRDHESLVRVPRTLREELPAFRRGSDRLFQRLEREPTDADLSHELRLTPAAVRDLRNAASAAVRRDDLAAVRELERSSGPGAEAWCDRIDIGIALAGLPPRERRVVIGSCVLGLTNVELGESLSLSARHVGRLRRRALDRMHDACALGIPA